MIERFNFFDIYGYLLPGGLLLVLFWLPFGLSLYQFLPSTVGSTVLALALAYLCGHILQAFGRGAFSTRYTGRYPSDLLLNAVEFRDLPLNLSGSLKSRLQRQIFDQFKIDVKEFGGLDLTIVSARRNDAFLLCRAFLIQVKSASYAEQLQGMYTLMGGLAAAFLFAGSFYSGLCVGYWFRHVGPPSVLVGLILALLATVVIVTGGFLFRNESDVYDWQAWLRATFSDARTAFEWKRFHRTALEVMKTLLQFFWPKKGRSRHPSFWLIALLLVPAGVAASHLIATAQASIARSSPATDIVSSVSRTAQSHQCAIAASGAMLALTAHFICLVSYRYFAVVFAATVYRHFTVAAPPPLASSQDVRELAFEIYSTRERPVGREVEHWLDAERQLSRLSTSHDAPPK